ncbi:hypothetical protein [Jidongwangia harbinensis]|uniref:hypothetical protein n=1 Tax=Jidongwangia harbinensis TaxID=2878561 RepID=UPI001CDA3501|nr:hypothetical protein [Jidongwangia harbinensis]MCA2219519.1 hypothetical protein [Jidongwangia harbinensis]
MSAPLLIRLAPLRGHRRDFGIADQTPDALGFGYSRDADSGPDHVPAPDGVDLISLTGRTPRRAA